MSREELNAVKDELKAYLPKVLRSNGLQLIYFMLTDILNESTELLCCGEGAGKYISDAYDIPAESGEVVLKGVVSRKKQLIPALAGVMQL